MWLKLLKPLEWIPYLTHKALMFGHLKLGKLVAKFNYVFPIKVELGRFPCYLGLPTHLHVCQSFHTENNRMGKISSKYLGQQIKIIVVNEGRPIGKKQLMYQDSHFVLLLAGTIQVGLPGTGSRSRSLNHRWFQSFSTKMYCL